MDKAIQCAAVVLNMEDRGFETKSSRYSEIVVITCEKIVWLQLQIPFSAARIVTYVCR